MFGRALLGTGLGSTVASGLGQVLVMRGKTALSDSEKLAFAEKVAGSLSAESAKAITDLTADAKKKVSDANSNAKDAEKVKAATEALRQLMDKTVSVAKEHVSELTKLGAVATQGGEPVLQYYGAGSGVIQIQSVAGFELWRDVMLRQVGGGVGIIQLMRPNCPACARIKGPLEQAIEMASVPDGMVAAIDVSCMNLDSCPLSALIQSDLSAHWNNYIPAFIGCRVNPTGYTYFAIDAVQNTLASLTDMLKKELALSAFESYNDALVSAENEVLSAKSKSDAAEYIGNLLEMRDLNIAGNTALERQLRRFQKQYVSPVASWANHLDSDLLSPKEQRELRRATVKGVESSLDTILDTVASRYRKLADNASDSDADKYCAVLASIGSS